MTSFAVIFALIITVPLGIFITRNKVLSGAATGIANVMQSIYPLYGPAGPGHRPDPDAANQPSGAAHDHALIMLGIRIAAVSSVGTSHFTKRNILGEIYTELIDINTNPQSRPALQPGRGRHHVLSGFGAGPH